MDTLGRILWYSMFVTPLITIPVMWKVDDIRKIYRIIISLVLAAILSYIFFVVSVGIALRDGLGPT
jgi:L-lactate permease